ncbi:class I SAM-dependent methyltransferase [Arthrobacter sp. NPDC058288]|uniref:class I SAM-dependent methyltransferase n=1 Tax=Arthrobacter sp. NPDC058288 TaxID=3346424 RepID=UPI0036E6075F
MARGGPKLHHQRRYELGRSFQDGGEHYDRVRPGYPAGSVEWLLRSVGGTAGASDAADIGAGTGKYTAMLVQRGLAVTAVDPSPDMLAQLRLALPGVPASVGTAEATGLPDAAFDVVTVAQAWHWCDPRLASTELSRILRPGGVLGLIWNQLDTSVPWVHRLSRIMHAGDVHKPDFRPAIGPEFAGLESHLTRWEDPVTTKDIVELAKSRSYYLAAGESIRAKVRANLDWYLHEHLTYSAEDIIGLPYLTQTWRAFKA